MNDGFLTILSSLTEDERNVAFVDANSYKWPSCALSFKPENWDSMDDSERHAHPVAKDLFDAILQSTSAFGRSEAWWVIKLKRTREEHAEWFASQFKIP